jgi:D-alanine-D-alanine ligase
MKKRRVLALMHEQLVPPEVTTEGAEDGAEASVPWRMERDVLAALRELGHDVEVVALADDITAVRHKIVEFSPHVVFNCTVQFLDVGPYDAHVVSYLELLRTPYTGCNPRGLLVAGDKALSKKVLAWHGIRVPHFAGFACGKAVKLPAGLEFPLIVKSTAEHASLGISQASIVGSEEALAARVAFVHENLGTDAIAEEYIAGRELTVGVLGNRRVKVLPVWEMTFDNLPDSSENIATSRAKWNRAYQERVGVLTHPAEDLAPRIERRIADAARRIYSALEISGYARIDMRMNDKDQIFVIEANPNPDLSRGEDFAVSADLVGLEYPELVQRIVNLGIAYEAAWKT